MRHLKDSLSLRLASKLNLAASRNSLAHSTKGTPSRPREGTLRLLVGTRFQVLFHSPRGVLFTFPSRYSFAIGHGRVFSLGGWSPLLRTGFHVSGPTRDPPSQAVRAFAYGAVTLFRAPFQASSASPPLCNWPRGLGAPGYGGPTTPRAATPPGFTACTGLGSSPLSLAATRGISFDFSSSGYLDVSVPPVVPARPMCSGGRARALPRAGFPIRRPAGRRPFAPLRRLSQLVASFVGFPCQGIRRVPLVSSRTFSLLRSLKIRFLL